MTHREDLGSRQSLDYIFECFYDEEINELNNCYKKLQLNKENLEIEKFFIKNIQLYSYYDNFKRVYTQLSDHYGLSCKLIYKGINFYYLQP